MPMLRPVRQGILWTAKAAWVVAAVGIFTTMVIIAYDVFGRYVLGAGGEWVFQSASSGLLAITFLALPYLYARDDHIAVDLFYDYLPRAAQAAAGWASRLVAVAFGLVLGWFGLDLVLGAAASDLRTSGAFSFPLSWVSAPMAFGGVLLALVALVTPAPAVDDQPLPTTGDEAA
jgi:TRAP-type C4-dicarboxylate transport system permease small subunit